MSLPGNEKNNQTQELSGCHFALYGAFLAAGQFLHFRKEE